MPQLFTIKDLCGGPAAVLDALLQDKTVKTAKVVNPQVALVIARGIVEQSCLDNLSNLIQPVLQDAYDMHVLTYGPYEACTDMNARDEWTDAQDNAVDAALQPYTGCVTASWYGVAAIDTRLHMPPADGKPDEITALSKSFAKEAWRVLTHYMDKKGEDKYDVEIKQLTSDEILAAAGIQRTDIEQLLATRPEPTQEDIKAVSEQQAADLDEALATMKEFIEIAGMDEATAVSLLENALDSDDTIALSGLTQLGLGMEHKNALDVFAMAAQGDDVAEALYELAMEGDGDADPAAVVQPPPAAAAPAAPPPAPVATSAPPPAAKPGAKSGAVGSIPPAAFGILRSHVKAKDEDMAAVIGVSRQTYINYSKPDAKTHFMPDPVQRATLVKIIDDNIAALTNARAMIATE